MDIRKIRAWGMIGCLCGGVVISVWPTAAAPLGTGFTYQGQLKEGGQPFDGSVPMVFELYDTETGGNLLGSDDAGTVNVAGGLFTLEVDFGVSPYATNEARWLQVVVDGTPLSPRQALTAAPFSLATRGLEVDADGNVQGAAGVAFGNDAGIGLDVPPNYPYGKIFDFSHTITDFSSSDTWEPFRSIITVNPDTDLLESTGIYSHDLETYVPPTNDKYMWYLQGPYLGALHYGTGYTELLAGGLFVSESKGDVNYQIGADVDSFATGNNTVSYNYGLEVFTGHYGSGGSIGTNTGIYVGTPTNNSPIGTNYGLYIEDQNVADVENYAIYSAGGDIYAAGRVAIGNDAAIGLGAVDGVDAIYDGITDFSHTITDFLSNPNWDPFRAIITLDPAIDLTGANATYIYGHDLIVQVPPTNAQDIEFFQGPYMAAWHDGTGTVGALGGALIGAENTGDVVLQTGAYILAVAHEDASITDNTALSISSGHVGVGGSITNNFGVYVQSPSHTSPLENHHGIYLEDQDFGVNDSYAIYSAGGDVYFNGDLEVTGMLSKGGGSFKIDHPLNPENKYLYHSFVESPDMKNIYDGNVVTDEKGYAVVELPEWFEALNRDFRYQLTVIGQFAEAIVSEKIHDNRFVIQTDAPGVEVSWQVTGIRHDAFAEANRIPTEVDKPQEERGKYLHPEAHGQARELGIGYREPSSQSRMLSRAKGMEQVP